MWTGLFSTALFKARLENSLNGNSWEWFVIYDTCIQGSTIQTLERIKTQ